MKKIYEYDKVTGEFRSETNATPHPRKPGEYLARAHATFIAPPETGDNEVAVFAENIWSIKPDFRGTTYYIRNADELIEAVTIKDLGVTVPKNAYPKMEDVPKTDVEKLASAEVRRASLLASTDWIAMRAMKTGAELPQEILDFDTAVRALENHPAWPDIPEADWPELPA